MVIFLYGSDSYRLKEARQNIVQEYRKKHSSGVNVFNFDLSDAGNLEKLIDAVKSSSFFNEHELIVLSGSFSKKFIVDKIFEIVKEYGIFSIPDVTLLFTEPSSEKELTTKSKDLFEVLNKKGAMVKVYNPLEGVKLAQWIQAEFELRNCSISRDALNTLVNAVGNDSWALVNEVEKLTSYKNGREVGVADVELLVNQSKELNVFDLIDAIASRNSKKAVELLYLNLALGNDPYYLISLIAGQFRNLLSVKDLSERGITQAEIVKKTGLHPFVVRKTMNQIAKFKTEELKLQYRAVLDMEIKSKTGISSFADSLFNLITNTA